MGYKIRAVIHNLVADRFEWRIVSLKQQSAIQSTNNIFSNIDPDTGKIINESEDSDND